MKKRFLTVIALLGIFAGMGGAASLPGLRLHAVAGPMLTMRLNIASALTIPGGVAFPGVARAENGETIKAIEYFSERADGQRVRLEVMDSKGNAHRYFLSIYDWQLGPIVKYANDDRHDSLVSYTGDEGKLIGGKHVPGFEFAYHSAVSQQLLGMRLWHADFLLFLPNVQELDAARVDLPTDETTGDYILGRGEGKPNVAANRQRLSALKRVMAAKNQDWETYVITDRNRQVSFSIEDDKFIMKGTPIWWFISVDDFGRVVSHEKYSEAITAVIEENGGINPIVYRALVNTMRYSALFRHIKSRLPASWAAFAKDVGSRNLGQVADTPTLVEVPQPIP